jgi:hypothetical protein
MVSFTILAPTKTETFRIRFYPTFATFLPETLDPINYFQMGGSLAFPIS